MFLKQPYVRTLAPQFSHRKNESRCSHQKGGPHKYGEHNLEQREAAPRMKMPPISPQASHQIIRVPTVELAIDLSSRLSNPLSR